MIASSDPTTQIYQVFIKATPEKIWAALTTSDAPDAYFYGSRIEVTADRYLAHGPDGSVWVDGKVFAFEPPRRLVHGWRSLYDPDLAQEQESQVTWEIEPQDGGYCMVTATHDKLDGAPKTAEKIAGPGWMFVLSNLKTVLETGKLLDTP
jgi:uncharacterized protein YndB with AHSA1/START domain